VQAKRKSSGWGAETTATQSAAASSSGNRGSQSVSEQLAAATHEMRTPLTAIKAGLSLMVEQSEAQAGSKELLELCRRNTDHLMDLINDLLDIARVESTAPASVSQVRLDTMIGDVIRELGPIADKQRATVVAQVTDGLVVAAVPDDVRRVLTNLIGNALKFSPGGHVHIDAEAHVDGTVLSVRDNGIGIAHDQLDTVFEPFVQADRKSSRQGSGLGLAIAKALVGRYGGSISATSEVGVGSCFTVVLPATG